MTADVQVIGIDPGPVPGFVLLRLGREPWIAQCSQELGSVVFEALLAAAAGVPTLVQVERFVVGRRASRSTTSGAGETTRDLIGALCAVAEKSPTVTMVRLRSAAAVKPWATDDRLDAAGLLKPTKGMTHARDAARHALFCACHDAGAPDPLSTLGAHR